MNFSRKSCFVLGRSGVGLLYFPLVNPSGRTTSATRNVSISTPRGSQKQFSVSASTYGIGLKKIKKPVYEATYWGTVWWGGGGVSGDL